ncbi:hypothetical protein NQ317_002502 [Molorchus minor]|uniref:DUF4485 domain-containing protein n=1 Tax=Molorchus minor TaxID=1323400 RepID=A0ABQ9JED3_9CUCU|nr:hypothetical protein NQ317_002502 [Molorchus minor]
MTEPDPLDQNFFFNSMLANSLVQLIPPNEAKMIRIWFDKLLSIGMTTKQKEIRNDFMWFILLMLQCRKIREPFNGIPPAVLPPLKQFVPTKIYEEILIANDDNMAWIQEDAEKREKFKSSAPSKFFSNQPMPNEGVICYISAFSDRGP